MQQDGLTITRNHTALVLLAQKVLFIPEFQVLCLADWHLGKAAHFRKAGIPVPQPDLQQEFDLVNDILTRLPVKQVIFLGDLFHSTMNNDWGAFAGFIHRNSSVSFLLIKGNHDVIPPAYFSLLKMETTEELELGGRLILTHKPLFSKTPKGFLNIAGHIHPGFQLVLKARQRLTLPCFHYSDSTLILPAFGGLTGLHRLGKEPDQEVFCVIGDAVVAV
jgi:DNA ligase-associated metallophosphoesterase